MSEADICDAFWSLYANPKWVKFSKVSNDRNDLKDAIGYAILFRVSDSSVLIWSLLSQINIQTGIY
jgi:hypothetical protein